MRHAQDNGVPYDIDPQLGRSGYVDVMNRLKGMIAEGRGLVDMMLLLREEFQEDLVEDALQDARLQGLL